MICFSQEIGHVSEKRRSRGHIRPGLSWRQLHDGARQGGQGPEREADKLAIDNLIKANVQAFNNRDAAAVAANWTTEGEYIRNNGEAVRGRADIQKGYGEFFKTLKGKPTLEVQMDSLRFTSADSALSQVTLRLKNEQGELISSIWRNTMLVREGGQWKVAVVQEWDRDTALDDSVKDLEWLIGTWDMTSNNRTVTNTYEWDDNKVFIRGKYTIKEGAKSSNRERRCSARTMPTVGFAHGSSNRTGDSAAASGPGR